MQTDHSILVNILADKLKTAGGDRPSLSARSFNHRAC